MWPVLFNVLSIVASIVGVLSFILQVGAIRQRRRELASARETSIVDGGRLAQRRAEASRKTAGEKDWRTRRQRILGALAVPSWWFFGPWQSLAIAAGVILIVTDPPTWVRDYLPDADTIWYVWCVSVLLLVNTASAGLRAWALVWIAMFEEGCSELVSIFLPVGLTPRKGFRAWLTKFGKDMNPWMSITFGVASLSTCVLVVMRHHSTLF